MVSALWTTIDAAMFMLFKFVVQPRDRDTLCDMLLKIFNGGHRAGGWPWSLVDWT